MKQIIIFILLLIGIWYFMTDKPTIKNADRPVRTLVAFGDSLTAGYGGGGVQNAYPAVLAELTGLYVINEGLSGETASHAPERLNQILSYQADMVLIEFGANDFMQGRSLEAAVAAVAQIVDAVQAQGAVAVIVDTAGPGMGLYTKAYKKLAKEKQALFVSGILKDIFNKKQYKSDMVHPNAAGYKLVAEHVYKEIKPYLH